MDYVRPAFAPEQSRDLPMTSPLQIRAARDTDAAGLIELIGSAYAEYPGCVLDVDGEEPDLRAIASAYGRKGGGFWVAIEPHGGTLVGSAGWLPSSSQAGWIELRKLYVARAQRRRGLASELCTLVESVARERGAVGISLWSDTRFLDAHRFYAARGYQQRPETRALNDLSNSIEYGFTKRLRAAADPPSAL
jgi:putative acetyltransferase